jgi:hypothetical protein
MRDKPLPGRCRSLDCGMLWSGDESALDCNQCNARSSSLMNDGTSKQSMLERKAKSIPAHPVSGPVSHIHIIEDVLKRLLVSDPITLSSIQGLSKPVG